MVTYTYDAWGKLLDITGSDIALGELNPLRSRGYVYDQESKLYYLQSRYYNPELCRFINADDVAMLGADGSIIGVNLLAYCDNNPVNKTDPNGTFSFGSAAIGALIGGVVGAAAAAITGGNATDIIIGAFAGAAAGAIIGATGNIEAAKKTAEVVAYAGRMVGSLINAAGAAISAKKNGASNAGVAVVFGTSFALTYGAVALSSKLSPIPIASYVIDCTFGFAAALGCSITSTVAAAANQETAVHDSVVGSSNHSTSHGIKNSPLFVS